MIAPPNQSVAESLIAMVERDAELQEMSDRDLVFACLKADCRDEQIIEEMMSRLYPRWAWENEDGSIIEDSP